MKPHSRIGRTLFSGVLLTTCLAVTAIAQTPWYPDIVVRQSDLYNNDIVTNISPGRTHLRFSNGTANIGLGPLHLLGILPAEPNGTQLVLQRIFRSDGSYWDDTAGFFAYHSGHSHTHFDDWCIYRLREILPGDGVGPIVVGGTKTSFCILDLIVYDNSLPNYSPTPYYTTCGSGVQGLSVGWLDNYTKSLPGQNIDVTDVPAGVYWLEAEADPDNNVAESDETNNIARIKVVLGSGGTINPDFYEPNDSIEQVEARTAGEPASPNLGPTAPRLEIGGLSVHAADNDDYFRVWFNNTGTSADSVRIDFLHSIGDLDLFLLDSLGTVLLSSEGSSNVEIITMSGILRGWYIIRVIGYQNVTNPNYELTINPPTNSAPSITIVDPPSGVTERAHGFENYTTTWTPSDPNGDPLWVTIYLDTVPVLNGDEVLVEASIYTDGTLGFHTINSAAVPAGTYWVYGAITDGGTVVGDWSSGQIAFIEPVDTDGDGIYDFEDNCIGYPNPSQEPACEFHGDPNGDGLLDIVDISEAIDIAFRDAPQIADPGCPHAPAGRTDVNCDGATDIVDMTLFINAAFRGASDPFCNPCLCTPYPTNCP